VETITVASTHIDQHVISFIIASSMQNNISAMDYILWCSCYEHALIMLRLQIGLLGEKDKTIVLNIFRFIESIKHIHLHNTHLHIPPPLPPPRTLSQTSQTYNQKKNILSNSHSSPLLSLSLSAQGTDLYTSTARRLAAFPLTVPVSCFQK
jgi:hypothetical protein